MSDRDSEAAQWFASMRAPAADSDRAAFDAWFADPANAEAYARVEEDWQLAGGIASGHLAAHRAAVASPPAPAPSRPGWALAAALVLALSLAFAWVLLGNGGSGPVVADNAPGEAVLEDGTRVALFEGARIDPKFSDTERRVLLTGGRARFTVAHDTARPFRVAAAGTETTALGTIFEIDLTRGAAVIHLVKGSVEVRAAAKPEAPLRLLPGQRAALVGNAPKLVETDGKDPLLAMSSPVNAPGASLIDADGLPLAAVIDRANRASAVKIGLSDPAIGTRLVSGRFDISNAAALARQLGVALDLDVREHDGGYLLTAK